MCIHLSPDLHVHVHTCNCACIYSCSCLASPLPPSPTLPPLYMRISLFGLEFPLTSLNLMDYCYVSDVGVANIVSMTTLTELTLSKTKLTDVGMHCVAGV